MNLTLRPAGADDLSALVELENRCFDYDRLSRRNFQWMLTRAHASLTVAEGDGGVLGYALVLFHEGTSLARLYSIAIDPRARGIGLGQKLLEAAEQAARDNDRAYMRLEVRPDNRGAIALYERNGYRPFATVRDYYEDHSEALRFEKRIRNPGHDQRRHVPFYRQTTDFTCGPACLLMAMGALQPERQLTRREELRLWREATTIYMTAGHGGCSPGPGAGRLAARLPGQAGAVRQRPAVPRRRTQRRQEGGDAPGPRGLLRGTGRLGRRAEALGQARHPTPAGQGRPAAGADQQLPPDPLQGPALCWSPTTTRTSSTSTIPTSTTASTASRWIANTSR